MNSYKVLGMQKDYLNQVFFLKELERGIWLKIFLKNLLYIKISYKMRKISLGLNGKCQKDYLDISSCCPFCTSSDIEEKKETILTVEKKYDSKLIEHLNKVIQTVSKLKAYFTQDTYDNIISISKNVDGLKKRKKIFFLK